MNLPPTPWWIEEQWTGTAIKAADGRTVLRLRKGGDVHAEEALARLIVQAVNSYERTPIVTGEAS